MWIAAKELKIYLKGVNNSRLQETVDSGEGIVFVCMYVS